MTVRRIQVPSPAEDFFRQNRHGRRRMLALTYEFDPAAFERRFGAILRQPIRVDVVAGVEWKYERVTSLSRFWRARWPGTFHPKMILLLASAQVLVGLGSANLTASGLGENLETWSYFEGDKNRNTLSGVRDFLEHLAARRVFPPKVEVEEFINALPKPRRSHPVLSTVHGPLFPQVVSRLRQPVRQVDIISPISSDPSAVVRKLRREVGGKEYRLYTGENPPEIHGITKFYTLKRPVPDDEAESLRAISLHAKIYAFYSGNTADLFWGSANLSYSAWLANGKRANAELLLHNRVSSKEWIRFRDKSLPTGYGWDRVTAKGKAPLPEKRQDTGWQLLHAQYECGEVWLEANKSGIVLLRLRSENSEQTCKGVLRFTNNGARLQPELQNSLGFKHDQAPRYLQWSVGSRGKWSMIPVNRLDIVEGVDGPTDLAQQLFWEFTGRLLPRPGRSTEASSSNAEPPSPPDMSADEEELTKSEHQGELDRFVLEWRVIACRVAQSCRGNDELRHHRVVSINKRIDSESRISPKNWPEFKRNFVRKLLDREWLA